MTELGSWIVIIPARLGSTRLAEKPLQDLGGKPLVIRVYEQLAPLRARGAQVVIATDHEKVLKSCANFKAPAVLTNPAHQSGTDRCWEVAQKSPGAAFILNVQGDEPFIAAADLERLMAALEKSPTADMATLVFPSNDEADFHNPNAVKAIVAAYGRALYFTRAAAPHPRDEKPPPPLFHHHIGVYAFKRTALEKFCCYAPAALENREKLEQLRALENGMCIITTQASRKTIGIDTPTDLEAARAAF